MLFTIPETMSTSEVTVLIQRLKNLTGSEVKKKTVVMLETTDDKAEKILAILLGVEAKKDQGPTRKTMSEKTSSATWEVIGPDKQVIEALAIEQKNMRMAAGKFEPGQLMRYKNGKYYTIRGAPGRPQVLVDKKAEENNG